VRGNGRAGVDMAVEGGKGMEREGRKVRTPPSSIPAYAPVLLYLLRK